MSPEGFLNTSLIINSLGNLDQLGSHYLRLTPINYMMEAQEHTALWWIPY